MAASVDRLENAAVEIGDFFWPIVSGSIDQLFGDLSVGWGEAHQLFALFGYGDSCGCEVSITDHDAADDLAEIVGDDELGFYADLAGKQLNQVIFEPYRAFRSFVIGGRVEACQYFQRTGFLDFLKQQWLFQESRG